jgi:hypothetical protein
VLWPPDVGICAEGAAYYERFLADEEWCAVNRATADMLREALEATGQDQPTPPDERTPAQRLHDQRFGVSSALDGRIKLPGDLSAVIEREAADEPTDRNAVAAQLAVAGMDAKRVIADAQTLLDKAGSPVRAAQLSAYSLAQLRVYAEHLRKHATSRPQKTPRTTEKKPWSGVSVGPSEHELCRVLAPSLIPLSQFHRLAFQIIGKPAKFIANVRCAQSEPAHFLGSAEKKLRQTFSHDVGANRFGRAKFRPMYLMDSATEPLLPSPVFRTLRPIPIAYD